METQHSFRLAEKEELPRIMEIIDQAKAQMKALGSRQWQDGYPTTEDIARDIDHQAGWVSCDNDKVIAYAAVIFDEEPAYRHIKGRWLSEQRYVVVHRMAVSEQTKGRGVATEFMRRVEVLARKRKIGSFRVDTNFDNGYMLRMLTRLEFTQCGEIEYAGGKRIAFEKLL